jgi:Na+-exporting ATPase
MGIFKRSNGLELNSRTSTTFSVTVPPKNPDFSSLAPSAHISTPSQLIEDLGTSQADGLSKNEAARRLESCGENVLKGEDGVSALRVLFGQFGESDSVIFDSLKLTMTEKQMH